MTSLAAPIDSGVGSRCSRDGLGTVPLATSSESGSRRGRDGLGTVSLAASSESGSRCSRDGLGTIASSAASTGGENSGSRCSPDGLGTISLSLTSGVGGEDSDSSAGPITVEHYWSDDSGCDQVAEIGTSSADGHTVSIRSSSGIMSASSIAVGGDTRCCMPSGVSTGCGDSRRTHRSVGMNITSAPGCSHWSVDEDVSADLGARARSRGSLLGANASSSAAASTATASTATASTATGGELGDSSGLSVDVRHLRSVTTPMEVLTAIWGKASELLHEPNAVAPAPDCDSAARMVKSYSGARPHLITRKQSGQFCCDSTCPNWRSLGICAHSVAAAEDNRALQGFVQWYLKAKKIPNLMKLATTNMPAGRGRKGAAPPRKRR